MRNIFDGGAGGRTRIRWLTYTMWISVPWEQFFEGQRATGQKGVQVLSLRHPAAVLDAVGQGVTLDDGHPVVEIGEYPGGDQPRHARAQYHCMFAHAGESELGENGRLG
jgi:hypothetical protein